MTTNQTNQGEEAEVVLAANEFKGVVDRILLAPYGDFKNVKGMQRFQRGDAEAVVQDFNSLLNTPVRKLGLPVYIGHPDHEHFKDTYKDKRAYGRVKGLEAAPEGLFANVSWSKRGKELIEDEMFSAPSVNWRMRYDSREGVWRPFSVKSVGLTNEPNIPVPAITAANEQLEEQKEVYMKRDQLIKKLKLDANATDEQIEAAIDGLETRITTAANEQQQATTELTTQLESERTKVTTAETNFANERKERIALLVASGLASKKITPAEKPQWEQDFANEFEATMERFGKLQPRGKTEFQSNGLGERHSDDATRRDKIQEFVNERMGKGEDYNTAYKNVKRLKPELFTEATTGQ